MNWHQRHSVFESQGSEGFTLGMSGTDGLHIGDPEFGLVRVGQSAFAHAVTHIVELSAEKQMGGADAERGVAVMQDRQAFGNRPESQHPGNAMGKANLPIMVRDAISLIVRGASPQPTFLAFGDAKPKPSFVTDMHSAAW